MKIALVDMANLKYMPYVKAYLNIIDLDKNDVHIIHWKREAEDTTKLDDRITIHSYEQMIDSSRGVKEKLVEIIKYRRYLRNELKKISPDFLIVHYQTTAILIYDLLVGKYKNKYILDYRDITHEKNKCFQMLVSRIVRNSVCTFISSEGFRKYLPDSEKIHFSHNVDLSLKFDERSMRERLNTKHQPLRIAFWGRVRNDKTNYAFIEAVSAMNNVELHYYGTVPNENLQNKMNSANNVFYHGSYSSLDRIDFAYKTDLLLNSFDKDDKNTPLATSNKFYDGILFYIPQICAVDSVMGDKCKKYGVGMTVNIDEPNFMNKVIAYYNDLNADAFIQNCNITKDIIANEVKEFTGIVGRLTNGEVSYE